MEELEPSYITDGSIKRVAAWKSLSQILTKLNLVSYLMTQQLHSQVHSRVENICPHENLYTLLIVELGIMAKKWKEPKYP